MVLIVFLHANSISLILCQSQSDVASLLLDFETLPSFSWIFRYQRHAIDAWCFLEITVEREHINFWRQRSLSWQFFSLLLRSFFFINIASTANDDWGYNLNQILLRYCSLPFAKQPLSSPHLLIPFSSYQFPSTSLSLCSLSMFVVWLEWLWVGSSS